MLTTNYTNVPHLQCEALPGRVDLKNDVCDWHIREGTIYDVQADGTGVQRKYGPSASWETLVSVVHKTKSSLPQMERKKAHFELYPGLLDSLYSPFEDLLHSSSGGSVSLATGRTKPKTVVVSVDKLGAKKCKPLFDYFGDAGFKFKKLSLHRSGRQQRLTCCQPHQSDMFIFEGQQDVGVFSLTMSLWAVLAIKDEEDQSDEFFAYVSKLPPSDMEQIAAFLGGFSAICQRTVCEWTKRLMEEGHSTTPSFHKVFGRKLAFHLCIPGSALAFLGSDLEHGMLIPRSHCEGNLCILTELKES